MPSRGGMSRARRYRFVGVVMASLLGVFAALAACSNQGEGDRCQAENGNDDCQDGLMCLAATQKPFGSGSGLVNPPFNNSDRCCPPNRNTATHPACVVLSPSVAGEGGAPPDATGPVPDATPDTTPDTAAPIVDSGSDADG